MDGKILDVIVVGGGIAGVSAAYEIAASARVLLLEREDQLAYHSTGRSAAMHTENYGNAAIRQLTLESRRFFLAPPACFGTEPLLRPRGMLWIARADQAEALERELEHGRRYVPSIHRIGPAEARALCPALRADYVAGAMMEPEAMDLDVHAIHQGYLKGLRQRGGRVVTGAEVTALRREGGVWQVASRADRWEAPTVVNAAGAWAGELGRLAGAIDIGLQPRRRTVAIADVGTEGEARGMKDWPCVIDVGESFYFKPESGHLMVSPADATPCEACDAQPEEIDVAQAIDRLERATSLRVRRVPHRWAGLRSFVADGSPVVGPDPRAPGFFWLAGQGGYGVMTSPAVARFGAGVVLDGHPPAEFERIGLDPAALLPARLQP